MTRKEQSNEYFGGNSRRKEIVGRPSRREEYVLIGP
jgi:hypothetical protein